MTQQVKNEGGIKTAEDIINGVLETIHVEFGLMRAAWDDLRPWYKSSRGSITFFAACDDIAKCQGTLEKNTGDVRDALRASNALLVSYNEQEQAEALKLAQSDDGAAAPVSHNPSYSITTFK